ncbi:8-oxo-dGTP pyrophosphatase MutT (NUDIX family) [Novosphingobium hassiacum]|uniref:GDP-mannose pyrophosphatase n=1 Tax=Novosphingobium hassiacum TaxID=173676 RepID=A0A7W5ZSD0_9SPHN|nr:NUDIX hydrolase [Novosphingobium hassiacum]MBB3859120.1 8-oxo-dGTP pyrophosphatase MutT (NUDIX family) [Novosphingobium hassiacum]
MTKCDVSDFDVFRVERKRIERGDGPPQRFSLLRCPDWVNVIAFTSAGNLALVRQFRHGIGEETIELPGGIVDRGTDPFVSAKTELLEEVGLEATEWQAVGSFRPNAALQDNWCHTYLCYGAEASSLPPEKGCEPLLISKQLFLECHKQNLLRHALMATAIMLTQEAKLQGEPGRLCRAFFS